MAFSDLPVIDKSALNSDHSATALRAVMSYESGFICREDIPDKGCDFDVELISKNGTASNWRFAVQLKSVVQPSIIEGGKYISYSFETSRLGYLMRRLPAMGIVVIFTTEDGKLYYETVDAIYSRLLIERNNDDWKNNDKVNIRIPIENELTTSSAKNIHSLFLQRFESAGLMQISHGAKYDLPAFDIDNTQKIDLNNPKDITKTLKKYGIALLSSYDLHMVFTMVSQLPMAEINSDRELQIIAAVAYCEAGKHAESAYYLDRIERRNDIAEHEQEMISFTKIKNDFALGKIKLSEFYNACNDLRLTLGNSLNGVTLDINIAYYQLLTLDPLKPVPDSLFQLIQNTYTNIDGLTTEDHIKVLLASWNTDNYSYLIGCYRSRAYAELNLRESVGLPFSLDEKRNSALQIIHLERDLTNHLELLQQKAKGLEKDLLIANIILTYNRHRLSHELDLITNNVLNPIEGVRYQNVLKEHIEQGIRAYNIFVQESRFKESYQAVCQVVDLIVLIVDRYKTDEDFNLQYFLSLKNELESTLEYPPYKSPYPELIAVNQNNDKSEIQPSDYKNMTDTQIEYIAGIILKGMRLPQERLPNIITEIKGYRLFYSRCTNPAYELLRSAINEYRHPIQFIIRSRITGLETNPSTDVEYLLGHWRL